MAKRSLLIFLTLFIVILGGVISFFVLQKTKEAPAPFGLSWGMSQTDFRQLGVALNSCRFQGFTTVCTVTSLPRNLPNATFYGLFFTPDDGLIKITYVSKNFHNNVWDIKRDIETCQGGRENGRGVLLILSYKYDNLRSDLSEQYGPPTAVIEKIESDIKCRSFFQHLADDLGTWASVWKLPQYNIVLELNGIKIPTRDWIKHTGYVRLDYESPKFIALQNEYKDGYAL